MAAPEGWQINPDWPSDTSGIVGYFHDASETIHNRTLFVVDDWRFFLGGEGDVQCYPFRRGGVLVILSSQCYLVHEESRRVTLPSLEFASLSRVTYADSHDIVVAVINWCSGVLAIGPGGIEWHNRSSYLDDIVSFDVTDGLVRIEVLRDYDHQLVRIALSLESGEEIEDTP